MTRSFLWERRRRRVAEAGRPWEERLRIPCNGAQSRPRTIADVLRSGREAFRAKVATAVEFSFLMAQLRGSQNPKRCGFRPIKIAANTFGTYSRVSRGRARARYRYQKLRCLIGSRTVLVTACF